MNKPVHLGLSILEVKHHCMSFDIWTQIVSLYT